METDTVVQEQDTNSVPEAPEASVPETPAQPIINSDGSFNEGWTDDEGLAKRFTSLEGLTGAYRNMERMMSTEKMPIPREDSPEDVWDYAYNRMGRPENASDYELEKPEDLASEEMWDEDQVGQFKEFAHKLGLSQRQASALVKYQLDMTGQGLEQVRAGHEATLEAAQQDLAKDWGNDFDANLELAQKAANVLDPEIVEDPVLANNPKLLKALAKVGQMMGEGRLKAGRDIMRPVVDVDAEIRAITIDEDPSNPWTAAYKSGSHPDHLKAVNYVQSLFKRKYPEE